MNFVKAHLCSIMLLLFVSSGLYTIGFFSDIEGPTPSTFAATELDQDVAGQPIDGLLCSQVETVGTILYSGNLGPLAFSYGFAVENATGTLCGGLDAELSNATGTLYSGPLLDLVVSGIPLAPGTADELLLELSLDPGFAGAGTCQFDTNWLAEQLSGEVSGFSDRETITHFVSGSGTGSGAGCTATSTVDLYLNKHISGETLGYELSDFFYRIVGNGIDVIVPHDSFTPLPIGEYTIEEIVPEGFVKDDWRIGWYGECERGDTFMTTITIDDGNIDHGTLYCEADNQYRPDHGRRDRDDRHDRNKRDTTHHDKNDDDEKEEGDDGENEYDEYDTSSSTPESGDGTDGSAGTGEGSTGTSTNTFAPGASGELSEEKLEEVLENFPLLSEEEVEEIEEELEEIDEAEEGSGESQEESEDEEEIESEEEETVVFEPEPVE